MGDYIVSDKTLPLPAKLYKPNLNQMYPSHWIQVNNKKLLREMHSQVQLQETSSQSESSTELPEDPLESSLGVWLVELAKRRAL